MPIGCRGREPGGARLSVLSPSRAWRESQSCGNWDTGGLGSARRDQSPRCAFVSTCGCVAVTCTPRVELRVLGFCPCLAGGKLSPEMKKPLPHGGGSLQGRGSWPCSQASTSGPSPPEAGERGQAVPPSWDQGTRTRREPSPLYQGALEAVWSGRLAGPGPPPPGSTRLCLC